MTKTAAGKPAAVLRTILAEGRTMANAENLIPMDKRSQSEARELGKKGGIASGASRRAYRSLKQAAKAFFRENDDAAMQLIQALYEEARNGNVKALEKLERRVADCEAEIEQTEAAISILEAKMATPEGASDMTLYEQHQKLKTQLDSVMEEWDAVSCELEEARK